MKVAVVGGNKNCTILTNQLTKYMPEYMFIDYGKASWGMTGFDGIINMGSHPIPLLKLLSADAKAKITVFGGTDHFGKRWPMWFKRFLYWLCKPYMRFAYCGKRIQKAVGIPGPLLGATCDDTFFYPRDVPRDKDALVYAYQLRPHYHPELAPDGATIIKGDYPYECMPYLYSRHKRLIRNTDIDEDPKMLNEALLCGCEVWFNGETFTEIQPHRLYSVTMPVWKQTLTELLE